MGNRLRVLVGASRVLAPLVLLAGCGGETDQRNEGRVIVTEPEKLTSAPAASAPEATPAEAPAAAATEAKP